MQAREELFFESVMYLTRNPYEKYVKLIERKLFFGLNKLSSGEVIVCLSKLNRIETHNFYAEDLLKRIWIVLNYRLWWLANNEPEDQIAVMFDPGRKFLPRH